LPKKGIEMQALDESARENTYMSACIHAVANSERKSIISEYL
jgi:hypothetical protein